MDPEILASARKHGISDKDMLHTYRNPIRVFELDDLVMLIGADEFGRLPEIGVVASGGMDFVVPAMEPDRDS